jgi:hypothetical protein
MKHITASTEQNSVPVVTLFTEVDSIWNTGRSMPAHKNYNKIIACIIGVYHYTTPILPLGACNQIEAIIRFSHVKI